MAGKHSLEKDELPKALKKQETKKEEKKNNRKKKRKGLKIFLIILLVLVIILIAILSAGYIFVQDKLGKMQQVEIDEEELNISENEILEKYRNIALFGVDSRANDLGEGNRSDCIIIASINNETKEVRLISVYRDTYLRINENGNETLDKITHAYSYGGAQCAINALNTNLDLNIKEFVTVNFDSVAEAVNALGGITINIESSEIQYINDYIDETSKVTGISSSHVTTTGSQTLDGVQAVAYSRIRYTDGGDYKRTERMRDVLTAMANKAKTKGISELNDLANTVLPKIYTNISSGTILTLLSDALNYKITESIGWPYETKGITLDRWYGVPVSLADNVTQLHKELFDDEEYTPSALVQEISNQIIKKTGYQ